MLNSFFDFLPDIYVFLFRLTKEKEVLLLCRYNIMTKRIDNANFYFELLKQNFHKSNYFSSKNGAIPEFKRKCALKQKLIFSNLRLNYTVGYFCT